MLRSCPILFAVVACVAFTSAGCDDSSSAVDSGSGDDLSAALDGALPAADGGADDFKSVTLVDGATSDATSDAAPGGDQGGPPDFGFFGPTRCATSGALLCEDFEKGLPTTPGWTMQLSGGATAVIDTTRAARGLQSMHIHATGASSTAYMKTTTVFPPSDDIFGRAYYYMVAPLPKAHATFFDVVGTSASPATLIWRYGTNASKLFVNYQAITPTTEYGASSKTAQPQDRWVCFEWEFKGSTNELHFWMDNTEITDIAIKDTKWIAAAWTKLDVGWQHYEDDMLPAGYDMWVDEVAIARKRVGCYK